MVAMLVVLNESIDMIYNWGCAYSLQLSKASLCISASYTQKSEIWWLLHLQDSNM